MGFIAYDGTHVQFEDRLLAHLQIVIVQKYKKQESFLMSWKDGPAVGDGRASVWLDPRIPIYFKFLGGRSPAINQQWLLTLGKSADASTGMIVTDENGDLAHANQADESGLPGTMNSR